MSTVTKPIIDLGDIQVSDLLIFRRTVAHGSMSAAGRELDLAPPVVSKAITRLEGILGQPLLVRSTRKMCLTEFGSKFYDISAAILREVRKTEDLLPGSEPGASQGLWNLPSDHPFGDWVLGEFTTTKGTTIQGPAYCSGNGRWLRAGSADGNPAFIEHEPARWRYFILEAEAETDVRKAA